MTTTTISAGTYRLTGNDACNLCVHGRAVKDDEVNLTLVACPSTVCAYLAAHTVTVTRKRDGDLDVHADGILVGHVHPSFPMLSSQVALPGWWAMTAGYVGIIDHSLTWSEDAVIAVIAHAANEVKS